MTEGICSGMLQIYSGTDASGPQLSQMCHADKGKVLTSSGNSIFVRFESDMAYSGKGFGASYRTVDSSKSIITSPQNRNMLPFLSCGFLSVPRLSPYMI
jgi:hypothetical protein